MKLAPNPRCSGGS